LAAALTKSNGARPNGTEGPHASLESATPVDDVFRLTPARTGDHAAIHRLLLAVFHGPTAGEFHAQLDEPGYVAASRLVVRHGPAVVGHVRASRRLIQLSGLAVPAVQLMDLATDAEYRGRGFASGLIAAAERQAREQEIPLALTRTRAVSLFARQGWAVCGRHVFAAAGARRILAHLGATSEGTIDQPQGEEAACVPRPAREPIAVRPLRRIELPGVMRVYEAAAPGRWGWPLRSEEYWEWLVNRGAYDRAYVVAEGARPDELAAVQESIRGYAFCKEGRIVELVCDRARPELARQLVARVCAEANELDHWQVRLDAPPDEELHHLFHQAGGQAIQAEELGGEVFMAKLLDPLALLASLDGVFLSRHRAAGLPRPMGLGLVVQCAARPGRTHATQVARLRLVFTNRGFKLVTGSLGRQYLTVRRRDLAPLILGHWHLADMIEAGRIGASSPAAAERGRVLFPKLPWWRPPLDDLLA
jgi:predicted N-acetyltransferase YhbS